jgi:hypothetical protein
VEGVRVPLDPGPPDLVELKGLGAVHAGLVGGIAATSDPGHGKDEHYDPATNHHEMHLSGGRDSKR